MPPQTAARASTPAQPQQSASPAPAPAPTTAPAATPAAPAAQPAAASAPAAATAAPAAAPAAAPQSQAQTRPHTPQTTETPAPQPSSKAAQPPGAAAAAAPPATAARPAKPEVPLSYADRVKKSLLPQGAPGAGPLAQQQQQHSEPARPASPAPSSPAAAARLRQASPVKGALSGSPPRKGSPAPQQVNTDGWGDEPTPAAAAASVAIAAPPASAGAESSHTGGPSASAAADHNEAQGGGSPEEPLSIFVKGVPPGTTEDDVRAALARFGQTTRVDIVMRDSYGGNAYVYFAEPGAVTAALAADGNVQLQGKTVRLLEKKSRAELAAYASTTGRGGPGGYRRGGPGGYSGRGFSDGGRGRDRRDDRRPGDGADRGRGRGGRRGGYSGGRGPSELRDFGSRDGPSTAAAAAPPAAAVSAGQE